MQAGRFMKTFIPLQLLAVLTLAPVASAQEVISEALAGFPITDERDHLVLNNDYMNASLKNSSIDNFPLRAFAKIST